MNLGWITFVNLILVLVLQKWEISLSIMTAACGIWSVAGYYVTKYHGSPLCFTMLRNVGTAMNVAGSYEYSIDGYVAVLLALSAVQVGLLIALCRVKAAPGFSWKRLSVRLVALSLNCLLIYVSMFDATPLKPLKTIGWDWKVPMNAYGYTCCLAEDLGNLVNPYLAPEGYESEAIEWQTSEETMPEVIPDVVLILNETFFDLTRYSDIQPDRDIFAEFYGLDNAALDTVHAANVPDELSGQVDEYLTSVDLSVQAFLDLTEYFETVDRSVILCKVGDHGPSFIEQLEPRAEYSEVEAAVAAKATPYVIWANFPLDAMPGGDASMVDLVPMVLRHAGLPLTPYYDTILSLHEELPIRTSDGIAVDRDGNVAAYTYGGQGFDLLTRYYFIEFNGLTAGSDFIAELFECPSVE